MRFVTPWILALLPLVPLLAALALWLLFRGRRRMDAFLSPSLQERFGLGRGQTVAVLQIVLASIALLLLGIAAARPQWGRNDILVQTRGRNLLIALDVSRSMLAADVHPNRLERAKVDIMDLLEDLQGDRAGLLAFRGKANLICPMTTDRAFLRQALDGISIDSAPRGETDIADAIYKALEAFESAEGDNNALILISDGEDLAGKAQKAAEKAGERAIPIFTVGIGDPSGANVPAADGKGVLQYHGKDVRSRMTEKTLSGIAAASGGVYIPLATSSTASTTLGAIYRQHLSRVAAKEMEERLENRLVERYQLFLFPALLLILVVASLSRGRLASSLRDLATHRSRSAFKVTTAARALVAGLVSSVLFAGDLTADDGDAPTSGVDQVRSEPAALSVAPGAEGARAAQRLYRDGRLEEASKAYLEAIRGADDPETANRYRYNAGLALYETGDWNGAAEILFPLLSVPSMPQPSELYGAAQFKLSAEALASTNAAAKAEALERSSAGFQAACRSRPEDDRSRRNLARAAANLPAVREQAHIEKVLAEHGKSQPNQIIGRMLAEQRSILREARALYTNEQAKARIEGLEALSERQAGNADLWIPLKAALVDSQAITNGRQRAEVAMRIEQTRDEMKQAASGLEDLSPEATDPIALSAETVYGFWKGMADPPALNAEAILAETNIVSRPEHPRSPFLSDAQDALELTTLFTNRFPGWAAAEIRKRQADTNAVPFTEEDAAKIMELSKSLLWLQQDAVAHPGGSDEGRSGSLEALALLHQIRDLLPKDKNSNQQQNQNQQQSSSKDQPQNQQNQDPQKQDQEKEDQQSGKPDEQEPKPQEKTPQAKSAGKEEVPKDVQEALRRAIEREKEHEADKKRRMRNFPMAPSARDW